MGQRRRSAAASAALAVASEQTLTGDTADKVKAAGPGGRGHSGPGGGRVDTAALAKPLGVTEDKLQAALAKELGLDATKVKSALEAQRPDRP